MYIVCRSTIDAISFISRWQQYSSLLNWASMHALSVVKLTFDLVVRSVVEPCALCETVYDTLRNSWLCTDHTRCGILYIFF